MQPRTTHTLSTWMALAIVAFFVVGAAPVGTLETIVPFDKALGELPEGITSDRAGNLYVSLAPLGEIRKIDRFGAVSSFATIGSPPFAGAGALGMEVDRSGNVYVAMATFAPDSHGVWRVAPSGTATRLPGSEAIGFPNALAFDRRGNLYVTDSLAPTPTGLIGRVWKIARGQPAAVWATGALLNGVVNPFSNPIGANGIVFHRGQLFVANTTERHIVRIRIRRDGTPGPLELFADIDAFLPPESVPPLFVPVPPLVDGLSVDLRGNLYVLVVGQHKLARLSRRGTRLDVLADFSDGLQLPASAAFGRGRGNRRTLFVTNFTFLDGLDNAALMAIDVGVPGPPIRGPRFRAR